MLWGTGPVWVLLFILLPETSSETILLRRAARLRRMTGNQNLRSNSEIVQAHTSLKQIVVESLLRPVQIIILDPAITFTAVYTSLVYGIYYSFFEAFPLVYPVIYGFNMGGNGLVFISVAVGMLLSVLVYCGMIWKVIRPAIKAQALGPPEGALIPALFASFLPPIGLFIFGMALKNARSIHYKLCHTYANTVCYIRLDVTHLSPLDSFSRGHINIFIWHVHHDAVPLFVSCGKLSSICCLSLCWQ
jgi:DHA1 family multidrug resistance protein-like MFS transporter